MRSIPIKRANIDRGHEEAEKRLHRQYFSDTPMYDEETFRRRYRVSKEIFLRIFQAVTESDQYFTKKKDACGNIGISHLLKITADFRILTYGVAFDAVHESLSLSKSTAEVCFLRFCDAMVKLFGEEYLRSPNEQDMLRILKESENIGIFGLLGSIECCKWEWKNCATACHGQYQGKEKKPTVTLEAIACRSLWIWHCFFGMPGCLNAINVNITIVESSPIVAKIASGQFHIPCEYNIDNKRRNKPFWFADGIYPKWPVFMQTIANPVSKKDCLYAKIQEGIREDIERAFGMLQSMWHFFSHASRFMTVETMSTIVSCIIIFHNMCVEERTFVSEELEEELDKSSDKVGKKKSPMWGGLVRISNSVAEPTVGSLAALCASQRFMEDEEENAFTKNLLISHIWCKYGDQ